jgi:hypothetical protein
MQSKIGLRQWIHEWFKSSLDARAIYSSSPCLCYRTFITMYPLMDHRCCCRFQSGCFQWSQMVPLDLYRRPVKFNKNSGPSSCRATNQRASVNLWKCLDNFSITRLYGRCCVSFLGELIQKIMPPSRIPRSDLRPWTFSECLASKVESRTLEEWAPSLNESLIEYSLSDLPRPWFRS